MGRIMIDALEADPLSADGIGMSMREMMDTATIQPVIFGATR